MRVVVLYDDLAALEGLEIRATHTVKITWQVDDDPPERLELDVCDRNLTRIREFRDSLRPSRFAAGKPVSKMKEARDAMKPVREWVDKNHIRARTGRDRPAYESPQGSTYWPVWVKRMYAEAQARGEDEREASGQDQAEA